MNRDQRENGLRYSKFDNKDLSGFNFSYANLKYSDFSAAELSGCDFSGANLRSCDFSGADLSNCKFRGADLTFANLNYAYLDKHNDFYGAQIEGAILPDSFNEVLKHEQF